MRAADAPPIAAAVFPRVQAFTLVELLVTIAILAVVTTLTLPVVSASLVQSRATVSLARVAEHVRTMTAYALADADRLPASIEGRVYFTSEARTEGASVPYWQAEYLWPLLLTEFAGVDGLAPVLAPAARRPTNLPRDLAVMTSPSYYYVSSAIADPALWSGSQSPDIRLIRGQSLARIRFPSQKAVMWDRELPYINTPKRSNNVDSAEPTPIAFFDTHADIKVPLLASPAVPNPFGSQGQGADRRLSNTQHGIDGRDY